MQINEEERKTADQNTRRAEVVASLTAATDIYVSCKVRPTVKYLNHVPGCSLKNELPGIE